MVPNIGKNGFIVPELSRYHLNSQRHWRSPLRRLVGGQNKLRRCALFHWNMLQGREDFSLQLKTVNRIMWALRLHLPYPSNTPNKSDNWERLFWKIWPAGQDDSQLRALTLLYHGNRQEYPAPEEEGGAIFLHLVIGFWSYTEEAIPQPDSFIQTPRNEIKRVLNKRIVGSKEPSGLPLDYIHFSNTENPRTLNFHLDRRSRHRKKMAFWSQ